jgi:hypothetical protein
MILRQVEGHTTRDILCSGEFPYEAMMEQAILNLLTPCLQHQAPDDLTPTATTQRRQRRTGRNRGRQYSEDSSINTIDPQPEDHVYCSVSSVNRKPS